jgi:hypothetical protein
MTQIPSTRRAGNAQVNQILDKQSLAQHPVRDRRNRFPRADKTANRPKESNADTALRIVDKQLGKPDIVVEQTRENEVSTRRVSPAA